MVNVFLRFVEKKSHHSHIPIALELCNVLKKKKKRAGFPAG